MAVTKCKFCGMFMPSELDVERHQRIVHEDELKEQIPKLLKWKS